MKLLLDENMPHGLRTRLTGHDVATTKFMGWGGLKNGRLLAAASAAGFDALLTTDKGIEYEQNPSALPMAVVIIDAPSNDFNTLIAFLPRVLVALNHLKPRSVTHVG